jgi:hypothetical protein
MIRVVERAEFTKRMTSHTSPASEALVRKIIANDAARARLFEQM